mmetsp:Transcript_14077/g.51131  ORF Transcript_14077/g.51131 Transcript_14077/m.51131 type:complete len:374 (+) Transcript_14077:123-1244(+)
MATAARFHQATGNAMVTRHQMGRTAFGGAVGRSQTKALRGPGLTRRRPLQISSSLNVNHSPVSWVQNMSSKYDMDRMKSLRLITAVKTPYLADGKIDLSTYDKVVSKQIECGVEGLIVGGTTGEGQLMSWDEHVMLIAHTVNRFGDKICVIGNTGSNSTGEAVRATCQGFAVGMHASLQINPYYGKTSVNGLKTHFNCALHYGPAIIYNVPARTSQDIAPELMMELAQHPNFLGIKECEGNDRIAGYTSNGVTCWSGNDDECHGARYDAGATGVISVTSNVVPDLMYKLMHEGRNDKLEGDLLPLMKWLFAEPNPIGVNTALAMMGEVDPVFRLPYFPYSEDLRKQGLEHLTKLGVENVKLLSDDDFTLISHH